MTSYVILYSNVWNVHGGACLVGASDTARLITSSDAIVAASDILWTAAVGIYVVPDGMSQEILTGGFYISLLGASSFGSSWPNN